MDYSSGGLLARFVSIPYCSLIENDWIFDGISEVNGLAIVYKKVFDDHREEITKYVDIKDLRSWQKEAGEEGENNR